MNTQAIERLRAAAKIWNDAIDCYKEVMRWSSGRCHDELLEQMKQKYLASLPTAQPTEVYVPVSVEDELPEVEEGYVSAMYNDEPCVMVIRERRVYRLVFASGGIYSYPNRKKLSCTHWLKPTKAILIPE